MSEELGIESGASSEGSASPESASPVQTQETASPQDVGSVQAAPKEAPFHEHPRFKELVEQKNQYAEQVKQVQAAYQQMQAQMQQLQKQYQTPKADKPTYEQLIARLEGIDPEFAGFQKDVYAKLSESEKIAAELSELKQYVNAQRQEQDAKNARTQLDSMYNEHKVPESQRKFYEQAVANLAFQRNASLNELPNLFKEAHAELSKTFEEMKRQERESYVKEKKTDKTPATQTGGTPVGTGKGGPMTSQDLKAALAKAISAQGLKI